VLSGTGLGGKLYPYWARHWSQLSKEEEKVDMKNNCRAIEGMVMELFTKRDWNLDQE
jgi:hypothetical protein